MEGYYHQQQQQMMNIGIQEATSSGDRFPQWTFQETKEFLLIRAELDRNFMVTKRNKLLWELVSNKMLEKGFPRTPDQCKSKWKNLVTRYKGFETMDPESTRNQFPFYDELHTIFSSRMHNMLWADVEGSEATTTTTTTMKRVVTSSEQIQLSDDEEEGDEKMTKTTSMVGPSSSSGGDRKRRKMTKGDDGVKEMLEEFMKQQEEMEARWTEASEVREEERRRREAEWRRTMAALEEERVVMERRWREREEQRWLREEIRAEKRDALVNALLSKVIRGDHI